MRSTRVGFFALTLLGGYFIWRNRFAIQRQLESIGIKTPLLQGGVAEAARSVAAKVGGKFEHGAKRAERTLDRMSQDKREVGNY